MNKDAGIVYLSYDGLLEPLGQSQVIAYLERLSTSRCIHLVSFEKGRDWRDRPRRAAVAERLARAGIHWHPRRYHKHPSALATAFDVGVGALSGLWLVWRHRLRIVHARSYVAGLMALLVKWASGARFLFDMRGFWVDERVDGGLWPREGAMYRIGKWCERRLLLGADHAVSLTQAGARVVQRFDFLQERAPPVTVIPTCADLARFHPVNRERVAHSGFILGYVGSAGTWYLFDEVAQAVRMAMDFRPGLRFLVVNRSEHAYIRQRLLRAGVPLERVVLRSAEHAEVPQLIARMHAAIFFIKPVFSKQASAPTKLAELLGSGVPCLGNSGVGDMAALLEDEGVGVALMDFDRSSLRTGLQRLFALCEEPGIVSRCADVAARHFSLEEGVQRYAGIYEALEGTDRCGS